MRINADDNVISAGFYGDNKAREIAFSVKGYQAEYGSTGTFAVLIQRNGDLSAYPVPNAQITVTDGTLVLSLKSGDLAKPGAGRIQLMYVVNDVVVMTKVYDMMVEESLVSGSTPPDPWVAWVTEVKANADRAEEAVEHYPYINSTNKHWMAWDVENEEWTDTGIKAEGTDGDDGRGIVSITKTGTVGLVDTYTITYTDGTSTTYNVTNGAKGNVMYATFSVDPTTGILSMHTDDEYTGANFALVNGNLEVTI